MFFSLIKTYLVLKRSALFTYLLIFSVTSFAQTKKSGHPALAMSDMAVNDIYVAMRNQYGDPAKLNIVKGAITNNTDGITVNQEIKLLNQFATDDGKIKCAEFLYHWCVDYKNYNKVQYNLGTPAAQKALLAFIKKQGNR